MQSFYGFAHRNARLRSLAERFQGSKPPRFPSVFEAIVNGIACQLSLAVGITLLNGLAEAYGIPFKTHEETRYSFPEPENLATATVPALRQLGFSANKALALIELATTLIISLGIVAKPIYLLVLEIAVVLMVIQAIVINRLAGLDYPFWAKTRGCRYRRLMTTTVTSSPAVPRGVFAPPAPYWAEQHSPRPTCVS